MKRRILWLLASGFMVLSLVLASCAPASPATTVTPTTIAPTTAAPTVAVPTTTSPSQERPKYGGVFVMGSQSDAMDFDQIYGTTSWQFNFSQNLVNDRLTVADWARGPLGTGELDLTIGGWAPEGIFRQTSMIAESWEVPDNQTIIYKIRKGVHFQNKPPVNGREMDANDVVFSIKYMYLNPAVPATYNVTSAPGALKLLSATALDKWTVEVKVENAAWAFFEDLGVKGVHIIARESIEKFASLKDWHNALGTGPYFLTDYVAGSSLTFVRNPDYWMRNPLGPGKGDQLPYLDGIKVLVMPDKSTAQAAFRTGRIDMIGELGHLVDYEVYQNLLQTNPQIKAKEVSESMDGLLVRLTSTDPLAKPLLKQRVRWALSMAIDRQAMIRDLYKGKSTLYQHFFPPSSPYYRTPDQMPETLEKVFGMKPEDAIWSKKQFEYHPDEAKKLLAEEGYPNGFKTEILVNQTQIDRMSIIADYWKKNLNVDLGLDVKETAVKTRVQNAHTFAAMTNQTSVAITTVPQKFIHYGPGDPTKPFFPWNHSEVSDPVLDKIIQQVTAEYGQDLKRENTHLQEFEAYVIWLGPGIWIPQPYKYLLWHPWVNNFIGNFYLHPASYQNIYYIWIDQDLKAKMTR